MDLTEDDISFFSRTGLYQLANINKAMHVFLVYVLNRVPPLKYLRSLMNLKNHFF